MDSLYQRLQPKRKLSITKYVIAQMLNIPSNLIISFECWEYIIFVHRRDRGGQFVSYRRLQQWRNAVASQIQQCSSYQALELLWNTIKQDWLDYQKQYREGYLEFLHQIWQQHWNLIQEQELEILPLSATTAVNSNYLKNELTFDTQKAELINFI
jgi:hypothetical protein